MDYQKKPDIVLSTDQAINFLQQRFHSKSWNDPA